MDGMIHRTSKAIEFGRYAGFENYKNKKRKINAQRRKLIGIARERKKKKKKKCTNVCLDSRLQSLLKYSARSIFDLSIISIMIWFICDM